MSKMPISWHRENLRNSTEYWRRERLRVEEMSKKITIGEAHLEFLAKQIAECERLGLGAFDEEQFMVAKRKRAAKAD